MVTLKVKKLVMQSAAPSNLQKAFGVTLEKEKNVPSEGLISCFAWAWDCSVFAVAYSSDCPSFTSVLQI